MVKSITIKLIILVGLINSYNAFSNVLEKDKDELEKEIKEYINHHVLDSYDFNLLSYTKDDGAKVYVGVPLPVLLWDKGLVVFSSSKLNHGKSIVQVGENYYKLYHNKIYKTDSSGTIFYDKNNHVANKSPVDFSSTLTLTTVLKLFS